MKTEAEQRFNPAAFVSSRAFTKKRRALQATAPNAIFKGSKRK